MADLQPPYFRCLKIHPQLYVSWLVSYFLFDSSVSVPDSLPHFCASLSASFFISFVTLPLSLSRSILSLAASLTLPSPRSPSASVSACSNMATRCPITRLILATIFSTVVYPPTAATKKESSSTSARYAVLFFAFSPTIHSSASIAPRRMIVLLCLLSRREQPSDLRYKLGDHAEPRGTMERKSD